MAKIKPELKAILDKYGINPRDESQLWDVKGTLVLLHRAFERIAAIEGIVFERPQIIRAERDEAVVLVVGRMGDHEAWSFGEAVIGLNYQVSGKQAGYPWAMAEKRAKDRVISKLVGLSEHVYSEAEADEFRGDRRPVEKRERATSSQPAAKQGKAPPKIPLSDARARTAHDIAKQLKDADVDVEIDRVWTNYAADLEAIKGESREAYEYLEALRDKQLAMAGVTQ